jgi:ArsR family transcriptional regulator
LKTRSAPRLKVKSARLRVSEQAITSLADVFKLLADKSRLKILLALAQDGEMHVTALCDLLTQSQPAVSHHLTLLRMRGLVGYRRDGKHNFYYVDSPLVHQLLDQSGLFSDNHQGNGHRPVASFRLKPR